MTANAILRVSSLLGFLALAGVQAQNASAQTAKTLYAFKSFAQGTEPTSNLWTDSGGNVYGMTAQGGEYGQGVVFELSPKAAGGWTESLLYSFTGGVDGAMRAPFEDPPLPNVPLPTIVGDGAGNLFASVPLGGSYGYGVVFELSRNSSGQWIQTVLHSFASNSTDGGTPGTILLSGGNIFGITLYGGTYKDGTVFELSPSSRGWTESTLYSFTGSLDGAFPSGLTITSSGELVGVAAGGGKVLCDGFGGQYYDCGTVWELAYSDSNWTFSTLYDLVPDIGFGGPLGNPVVDSDGHITGATSWGVFQLTPGLSGIYSASLVYGFEHEDVAPMTGLALGADGSYYGTGGLENGGSIYKLTPNAGGEWTRTVLWTSGSKGGLGLTTNYVGFDNSGNLIATLIYGSATCCGGTVLQFIPGNSDSWKLNRIYEFEKGNDGAKPSAALIRDQLGNLYGVTEFGGNYQNGTVFELSPQQNGNWKETILYSFQGGQDGSAPLASLTMDSSGNLYGTTFSSTTDFFQPCSPCGTVFELSAGANGAWIETVLHRFSSSGDGAYPKGGLVFDQEGNLYGTTAGGGANGYGGGGEGYGTLFELSPSAGGWTESGLYSFDLYHGAGPWQNLVIYSNTIYGVTLYGGDTELADGVVYAATANDLSGVAVAAAFEGTNGSEPIGLTLTSDGKVVGTTAYGGVRSGGVAFDLGAGAQVFYNFPFYYQEGPTSGFTIGGDGKYYFVNSDAVYSLENQYGVHTLRQVYQFRGLHSFGGLTGNLIPDSDGNLYGVAYYGGYQGAGGVYEITVANN